MQNMPIGIFRGDDTDAFSYQTIVGTINTDLDLTGCRAVFRYLGFSMEFDPIPEDRKLTIVIPADETKKFPPGLGYASLRVYDSEGRLKTFSNRIMVFVATKTPMFGSDAFEVDFNVRATLEPLKFFIGPNPDDFDEYRGYVEKVIDRASAEKYGLAILLDAIDSDLGAADGVAATPVAVRAAYAAIIDKLTDDYYTAEQTDEAIDRVAAYYITYDAAGNPFPTRAALLSAQTVYSGGKVRTPTRNDYAVVLADEKQQGAEWRYIYAVAEGQTVGQWEPQYPIEGVMTVDQSVTKDSQNPVSGGGVWSAIWGALSALPAGFSSLYDWCVAQLAGKLDKSGGTMTGGLTVPDLTVGSRTAGSAVGVNSVAEGRNNTASGDYSHAEGHSAVASGNYSHAEGSATASGGISHAEGAAVASGNYSHAEGDNAEAYGSTSHAEGRGTGTLNYAEHAQGIYNVTHKSSDTFGDAGNTLSSIGFGTNGNIRNRKNAVETMQDGKTFIYGLGGYDGTNPTSATDLASAVNAKANRASNPTAGNLAALDASGNPTDSRVKPSDKLDSTSAAPAFSSDSSVSYHVDSRVTYNGKLYKCTTATTGGTWDASKWTADTMTDPDAVLDITAQNQLRVMAKDGTLLWAQGYDLASTSSATLACDATNNFTFADGATTQAFSLPTAPTGKVGDFGLDIDNSANKGAATISFTNITNNTASVVIPKGENLNDMLSIAAGELARFYISLSTFRVNNLPTWHIVKQVVENGGAQS